MGVDRACLSALHTAQGSKLNAISCWFGVFLIQQVKPILSNSDFNSIKFIWNEHHKWRNWKANWLLEERKEETGSWTPCGSEHLCTSCSVPLTRQREEDTNLPFSCLLPGFRSQGWRGVGHSALAIEFLFIRKQKMTSPWLNNISTDDETSTAPLKCAELFSTVATIVEVYTQTEVRLTAHKRKSYVYQKNR